MTSDERLRRWQRRINIWIAIFTAIVFYSIWQLRSQNSNIQHSRVRSCQVTYRSFRDVFEPFFRDPKVQTLKEKLDQAKFEAIITEKIKGCSTQTKP